MLSSYWDSGYIKLNVENPANPQIIGDSAFDQEDPLVVDQRTGRGYNRPEGNGHQGEFSHDNRFVLAADEDFSTYRTDFEITSGPNAGSYESGEFGFSQPIATLPDRKLNGPTVYGGYGCAASPDPIPPADTAIPPASLVAGEEQIVVFQRGPVADPSQAYDACRFDEKLQNAIDAGYEGAIIANHHNGAGNGAQPDASFCGSGDPRAIRGMCIGHRAFHLLFNDPPDYDADYTPNSEPPVGSPGERVAATARFDGWGYTHLYRNAGADLEAVDHFAIEEAIDERYASGFGDLSVHEFATDPTEYLVYSSYYAGGMRVFRFGDAGLEQTGKFIDQGGSNYWGVEQFTTPQGDRLFAGSDRDFGLYLFRYTGPGAAQKPACSDVTVMVAFRESTSVPLACSDANNNSLRQSRLSTPEGGTIADRPPAGGWTYTHTSNRLGPAGSFTFRANDGAADSNVATASLVAVAKRGRCVNPFTGTNRRDVIVGSGFGDRIRGRRAGDSLRGRAGVDCLFGDAGNDRLSGDASSDRVSGNAGNDRVSGNAGRDRLSGNAGRDRLFGGAGNDRLFGGAGNDALSGGAGPDRLRGGAGKNRYSGGAGNDRVFARNRKVDRIRCGRGRDRVRADANDRVARDCERIRRPGRG
jgi:RTX calcium-binding nonapeptide repeat (4 copies)/PA domain